MKLIQMRLDGLNVRDPFKVPHIEIGMVIEWSRDVNYHVVGISVQGNADIIILNVRREMLK